MRNTCLSDCYARSTHPIVVHTHARSGEGWVDWGDSHEGYGVGLTVEYPWHKAPRPQRGQRSGSARLSSGPADRCVPFCPFFEATRGKRAANHQVCSGLPLPTAVVPLPQWVRWPGGAGQDCDVTGHRVKGHYGVWADRPTEYRST